MVTSMTSMHGPCIKTTRTLNTKSPTPSMHVYVPTMSLNASNEWNGYDDQVKRKGEGSLEAIPIPMQALNFKLMISWSIPMNSGHKS